MYYPRLFFVLLQLMHRPGAACSNDHHDVLCSSRSMLHGVCALLAMLDFRFHPSFLSYALHTRPQMLSLQTNTRIMFTPIVFVHARMQLLWAIVLNGCSGE